jgi:hypothetical protein
MAIPSRQIGWSTTDTLLWQISKQLEYLTRVTYNSGTTTTTTTNIDPNCISFVANTTSGGLNFGMTIETSADVTYTVNWGDETSDSGSITTGNFADIEHTYADEITAYTVMFCFSDVSAVTSLSFWGND